MRIFLMTAAAVAITAFVVIVVVPAAFRAVGMYRINRAGPRPLRPAHHVLWRDPESEERRDLRNGPGGADGAPSPPFRFLEEHRAGSQPCVSVMDGRSRRWRVK